MTEMIDIYVYENQRHIAYRCWAQAPAVNEHLLLGPMGKRPKAYTVGRVTWGWAEPGQRGSTRGVRLDVTRDDGVTSYLRRTP